MFRDTVELVPAWTLRTAWPAETTRIVRRCIAAFYVHNMRDTAKILQTSIDHQRDAPVIQDEKILAFRTNNSFASPNRVKLRTLKRGTNIVNCRY